MTGESILCKNRSAYMASARFDDAVAQRKVRVIVPDAAAPAAGKNATRPAIGDR